MPVTEQHKSVVSSSGRLASDFPLPPAQAGAEIALLPEKPLANWAGTFADILQGLGASAVQGDKCVTEGTQGILWVDHGSKNVHVLEEALRVGRSIKWVQLPMSGINAYATVVKRYPHIIWTSAKGAYAQPVAEHALTLTLALLRHIPLRVRADSWGPMLGYSLFNRRVLIIGAGGISLSLLSLLSPFTPKITLFRRRASEKLDLSDIAMSDEARSLVDTQGLDKLHSFLPEADVVVIAAALTADTHHVIGEKELGLMKHSAVLVNVARGEHVDTPALIKALQEGQIAGAGLDVVEGEPIGDDHPLWNVQSSHKDVAGRASGMWGPVKKGGEGRANLIITPHTADTLEMVMPLFTRRFTQNAQALLSGDGSFEGVVDAEHGY